MEDYKLLVEVFDKWLMNEPDPESVRDIQRFWKGLKEECGIKKNKGGKS